MPTVDVRIERMGSGQRLFLHCGLWGPATSVLQEFGRACRDGRIISCKWNIGEISEVTTGTVGPQALDAIADWDWRQSPESADKERVAARDTGMSVLRLAVGTIAQRFGGCSCGNPGQSRRAAPLVIGRFRRTDGYRKGNGARNVSCGSCRLCNRSRFLEGPGT
jgi:hypothetical protein